MRAQAEHGAKDRRASKQTMKHNVLSRSSFTNAYILYVHKAMPHEQEYLYLQFSQCTELHQFPLTNVLGGLLRS